MYEPRLTDYSGFAGHWFRLDTSQIVDVFLVQRTRILVPQSWHERRINPEYVACGSACRLYDSILSWNCCSKGSTPGFKIDDGYNFLHHLRLIKRDTGYARYPVGTSRSVIEFQP